MQLVIATMPALRLLLPLLSVACAAAAFPEGLEQTLQAIVQNKSALYNCSFSLAVRSSDGVLAVADGITDFKAMTKARVTDKYAWGSVTKMHTAASIMKLVADGVFTLDHTVGSLVDNILGEMQKASPGQNFSNVWDLWGTNIANTTIRALLGMHSGVPDFDTATPSSNPLKNPTDPLRTQFYNTPDHAGAPTEMMSEPWVAHNWVDCVHGHHGPPGAQFCYSSTNFMLLGLVLAQHANLADWKDLDQTKILPDYLKDELVFATDGTPVSYGAARGYDRTKYNQPKGSWNDHDVGDVKGVFAGWTASNAISSAAAMANMTWEIYSAYSFAPKEFIDQMKPPKTSFWHPISIYGMGTFNLDANTGQSGAYGEGYGHLGATYGYNSISAYFPALNITVSVATNIETDNQVQPADALCFAYNAIAGAMLNQSLTCTFKSGGFYGGLCKCTKIKDPSTEASTLLV